MTVTIVIRCLNEERHLPTLLDALARQTHRPHQVVVVDSGSIDGTVSIARQRGAEVVQISPQEFSFGRALNRGAQHATGDILVLVSAHTYPLSEEWLERLLVPFADPGVALAYGAQRGDHRSKFSEQQIFWQWFPPESCLDQQHHFCNNANAAVRRAVWQSMPYDEEIPGLEDLQWAKRARQRGFKVAYVADAAIAHVHEEAYRQIYHRYRREAMGLRAVSPGEHMRAADAARLFLRSVATDLGAARHEGVVRKVIGSILYFRAAQYWGTYRGLRWRTSITDEVRARLYYPTKYSRPAGDSGEVVAASRTREPLAPAIQRDGNQTL